MPPSEPTTDLVPDPAPPEASPPPPEALPVARPIARPATDRDFEHVYDDGDGDGDFDFDDDPRHRRPRRMALYVQLGLPKCSSVQMFGKPCPACGMTTSFALLTHGDVVNSMRANWVGTLMCAAVIVLTPWLLVSAVRGRLLWVRNGELFSTIILSGLLLLMVGRWAWIMFVP